MPKRHKPCKHCGKTTHRSKQHDWTRDELPMFTPVKINLGKTKCHYKLMDRVTVGINRIPTLVFDCDAHRHPTAHIGDDFSNRSKWIEAGKWKEMTTR